jgi:hypothetical protein
MTANSTNITETGLPINDTSTGTFSTLALTTKGDMLVHDGTNYQRLPVGTDGEVLQADSAISTGFNWNSLTFTGDYIPISNQSASSSASIEFTDLDFSTYGSLVFYLEALQPETDNVELRMLFSVDNGSTYLSSDYSYVYRILPASTGTPDENHSSSASYVECVATIGNATNEGVSGWMMVIPSASPGVEINQTAEWQMMGMNTSTGLMTHWGGAQHSTTSVIDAIKFEFSSGNIGEGNFYLYGYNAS